MKRWLGWGSSNNPPSQQPQPPTGPPNPSAGETAVGTGAARASQVPAATPIPSQRPTTQLAAGEWECPMCTLKNASSSPVCAACECPHPSSSPSPATATEPRPAPAQAVTATSTGGSVSGGTTEPKWCCQACTFENSLDAPRCVMCATVRVVGYAQPIPVPPAQPLSVPSVEAVPLPLPATAAGAPPTSQQGQQPGGAVSLDDLFGQPAPSAAPVHPRGSSGSPPVSSSHSSPSPERPSALPRPASDTQVAAAKEHSKKQGHFPPMPQTPTTPSTSSPGVGVVSSPITASAPAVSRPARSTTASTSAVASGGRQHRGSVPSPSGTATAVASAGSASALSVVSESELQALEVLLAAHRYHEMRTILCCRYQLWLAQLEQERLNEARMIDERLEEAIEHRDAMNGLRLKATERVALLQFIAAFPRIAYCPLLLQDSVKPCPSVQRVFQPTAAKQKLQDSQGPSTDSLRATLRAVATDSKKLEEACRLLQEGEEWESELCYAQAQTPSEALLSVCLTELCRSLIHLCCTKLHVETGDDMPDNSPSHDMGPRGESVSSNSSFCATMQPVEEWELLLKGNLALLRNSESGRRHIDGLTMLVSLARHTHAFKVKVEVQAEVSLLMADVLSLFDRILPKDTPTPCIDRKKAKLSCELCGKRLDDEPSHMVVKKDSGSYYRSALALWKATVRGEGPGSSSPVG